MLAFSSVLISLLAAGQAPLPEQTLQRRCELRIDAGDVAGGLADCGAAIALDRSKASSFLFRGMRLWKLGRFAEAYSDFSAVLEREPRHCSALAYRGAAVLNMGELPMTAEQDLEAAVACDPKDAFAHYTKGVAKMRLLRVHEALAAFTSAVRLSPDYVEAYAWRAVCYEQLHNTVAAAQDRQRAAEIQARVKTGPPVPADPASRPRPR
jgi:tetratricopeptide (TPR) repeat protein